MPDGKEAEKERKKAKKLYSPEVQKRALEYAHELETEEVPSEEHILKEHKHLVHHEEDLKTLLHPVNIAPVRELGKWKPGEMGVEEFPRIEKKLKKKK